MSARFGSHLLKLIAATAVLACGDSSTGLPVRGPSVLKNGEVVTGSITAGGTGSFLINATSEEARLFLQATSQRSADTLIAVVTGYENSGGDFGAVTSIGTDGSLDDQVTRPIICPTPTRLLVTVRGKSADDAGSYKLVLRVADRRPETQSGAIAQGDTVVGESIDRYGDVDEFTFSGTAGDELIVFLQHMSPEANGGLRLSLLDSVGLLLRDMGSNGVQRVLEERSTSIRLPANGRYKLRLSGQSYDVDGSSWRGMYRFWLYRVNRAPERSVSAIAVGDTVTEAIDAVGDIDEFHFYAVSGQELQINLAVARSLSSDFQLEVWGAGTRFVSVTTRGRQGSLDEFGTGRFVLPISDTYSVRLSGASAGFPDSTISAYRFELYPVDRTPESIASSTAVGSTVRGEAIDRPGDVDEFTFTAEAGEQLNLFLTMFGADIGEGLMLEVEDPSSSRLAGAFSGHIGSSYGFGRNGATGRFTAPRTGAYTVRVSGVDRSAAGYAFEIYRINPAPETVAPQVVIGTPVTAELFDRPGDVDEFTFAATAGQELNIFLKVGPGTAGAFLTVSGLFAWASSGEGASGVFTVPATNTYGIQLIGELLGPSQVAVGQYEFLIYPINRAPETLRATFAIGDTVTGESIDPAGDIDEFTVAGNAGDRLHIFFEANHGGAPRHFIVAVYTLGTNQHLSGVVSNRTELELGNFTLPSTDTYRVRVYGSNRANNATDIGAYRFALVRQP